MRRLLCILLAIFPLIPVFAQTPTAIQEGVTGFYQCKGYDAFNKENYVGTLKITRKTFVYDFYWQYTDGTKYNGTGFFSDNVENTLAVVFRNIDNPKEIGAQVYLVKPEGKLLGNWTFINGDKINEEVCIKTAVSTQP